MFTVRDHYSGNYQWQIDTALTKGDVPRALRIAENQYAREYYDFESHRMLARALVANGDTARAIQILETSQVRERNALASGAYIVGFDSAKTAGLLSDILSRANRLSYAAEMCRFAADEGTSTGTVCEEDNRQEVTTAPEGIRWVDMSGHVQLSDGVSVTSEGHLLFDRNATASLEITPDQNLKSLWMEIRSDKVMGTGGLLGVNFDNQMLTQIYGNSAESRLIALPISLTPATTCTLSFQFLNDGFDPISAADRNFSVIRFGFAPQTPQGEQ